MLEAPEFQIDAASKFDELLNSGKLGTDVVSAIFRLAKKLKDNKNERKNHSSFIFKELADAWTDVFITCIKCIPTVFVVEQVF